MMSPWDTELGGQNCLVSLWVGGAEIRSALSLNGIYF